MKQIISIFILILISFFAFSQEEVILKDGKIIIVNSNGTWQYKKVLVDSSTFFDARDGHVYKTITIGKHIWLAENLAYKVTFGCWSYDNNDINATTYGYLYNWESSKKVCPSGWHLPSNEEWASLAKYLGGEEVAGDKLKDVLSGYWKGSNSRATNEFGFSAFPGGYRSFSSKFKNIGYEGNWWSASEFSPVDAWFILINNYESKMSSSTNYKSNGFSVRCIED